jgi:hypothetical protein
MRALAAAIAGDHARFLLLCAQSADNLWDGGNQWSWYPAFLSFFRHVAHLRLDYSKWQHYETAARCAGPRAMHADFCIISDRPVRLLVDEQHRPHCADGPFCAWSDGTALWAWHGVRVPAWVITTPERITPARIRDETNVELRRVLLERYGFDRFVVDSGAIPVHADDTGALYRLELPGDEPLVVVSLMNSTPEPAPDAGLLQAPDGSWRKRYVLRVPPEMQTARQAVAWTFGKTGAQYAPQVET